MSRVLSHKTLLAPRLSKHGVSPEPSESLFQPNVCLTSPPLPSPPAFCPLPRFPPLHPPSPVCPIFLLLVFEPSSSPPHPSLLYLSSHYFSVLFHFFPVDRWCVLLYFLTTLAEFFAPQRQRFAALHWSTFSDRGARGVCTYHTQVDWREGLWHWQIIERVQHVVQVIFLGETDKQ